MRIAGIHLVQAIGEIGSPRPSSVARVGPGGALESLTPAGADQEILDALGDGVDIVVIDAPLVIPGETGRRDLERVCAWCDIPLFPTARRRVAALHGGLRAMGLAPALGERAGAHGAWEASPAQVLRQLIWEREHPPHAALDLAEYRARWAAVRAPRYRPKGAGRADARGLIEAAALIAGALDLGGWTPRADGGATRALTDAAHLDALCCAIAGLRALADPPQAARLGDPAHGRILIAAGPELEQRIALTLARMRSEGSISI